MTLGIMHATTYRLRMARAVRPRPFARQRTVSRCFVRHMGTERTFYTSSTKDTGEGDNDGQKGISARSIFAPLDTFPHRHIGPSPSDTEVMLKALDPPASSLDEFVTQVLPSDILSSKDLHITRNGSGKMDQSVKHSEAGFSESRLLLRLRTIAGKNKVLRSYIGCGYAGTRVPEVIKRNVLEGPGWYTSYTPYQPEISQGRLESLLNFQTMVSDLTGLAMANASVLDEPTAAAEAMTLAMNSVAPAKQRRPNKVFFVSHLCHPQTIAVIHARAEGFGITVQVGDVLADGSRQVKEVGDDLIGLLVQYPDTEGGVQDFADLSELVHKHGAIMTVATDLLALTVLKPPGEFGADVAFGNSQRFGVPFGFGGPHAAFFATSEKYKRKMPGRIIGLSKDRLGDPAARLALQTREQHIRREKATSNICTAQALLANMSAFYAIYHGPQGLRNIAQRTITLARILQLGLIGLGYKTGRQGSATENHPVAFDTIIVQVHDAASALQKAVDEQGINLRLLDDKHVGITLDETVDKEDVTDILDVFASIAGKKNTTDLNTLASGLSYQSVGTAEPFQRTSPYLTHPVFNTHHSETELLRYIHHLQSKDLSLTHSMIPLGSCTMKLNATTEMVPVTWPEFSSIHPFVPPNQAEGYSILIQELENDLAEITGFDAISLQPNSGAQGEFAGLRVIREYQKDRPGKRRDICLIPVSAHGTNPASATMAGMRVVAIKCDNVTGNLDMADLKAKCEKHQEELAAIMITYPSTFGVFEPQIKEVCDIVHKFGGQVYMDGANMNAQIGLCSPGEIGADVCHLNLHKTFCIPHGGGGPGVGPIGVKSHLAPYLPGHPLIKTGGEKAIPPISGAPWGSASILPISWAYIKMMGGLGLTHATKITLLNANYILSQLKPHYPIVYTNDSGRCAHEFILDVRNFKESAGIEAIDVAKRLQDYGFHAPTMSWPVANTLMIEPTESESKEELDRFCDALIQIRKEIAAVENGDQPKEGNVLKMAPHSMKDLLRDDWDRSYTRETAAYPLPYLKEKKFWPSVTRLDDSTLSFPTIRIKLTFTEAYGDLNLFCTCAPVEEDEGANI
jgi:glycine dehydrogenase